MSPYVIEARAGGSRARSAASRLAVGLALLAAAAGGLEARPRFKQNLGRHYGEFLPAALAACTTCHVLGGEKGDRSVATTVSSAAFAERMPPHNAFGARLREVGALLAGRGEPADLGTRLALVAGEDADGDGVANEVEILAGHAPGDAADAPSGSAIAEALERRARFLAARPEHPWRPFARVERPPLPAPEDLAWSRGPVDVFVARERERRGLVPRPEAPPHVLLRRVALDLTGLTPTPEDLRDFLADARPDSYERAVDRLLASPRHGERWGRHWMDVWRYSDWAGWGEQVRDSQPHIWRWRDWIVESVNADGGYDRMVVEMLAGDEIAPGDDDTLRATGYLVRSFKLLSREAWMQEAVDHAGQAFLGVTLGCARCHDHMYDPVSQEDYYRFRAIFEPYNIRIDRLPGEPDLKKQGLPRAFDATPDAQTFLFVRGDDRNPVKDRPLAPATPPALGGALEIAAVDLPLTARVPEKKAFIIAETLAASTAAVEAAKEKFRAALLAESKAPGGEGAGAESGAVRLAEMGIQLAEARREALQRTIAVERLDDAGGGGPERDAAATAAFEAQRWAKLLAARHGLLAAEIALEGAEEKAAAASGDAGGGESAKKAAAELEEARKARGEAEKRLAAAREEAVKPPTTEYERRKLDVHPETSTGRRLGLARWIVSRENPLAARVAANHIWLRHFGRGLVPSPSDFGYGGREPSHPALLDWLAVELMEPAATATPAQDAPRWWMKRLHRLLVTSSAYRLASTPDERDLEIDPDNVFLWRMSSKRLEAEAVRDNVLHASGRLDLVMGGPEIDHRRLLETRRRSIYYRHAAEKQAEFLKVFDMAGVDECYERKASVVPQQALALSNSRLGLEEARALARRLAAAVAGRADFVERAFERVLARPATAEETAASVEFLETSEELFEERRGELEGAADPGDLSRPAADPALRAREGLVHVLFNHNDFVTVR